VLWRMKYSRRLQKLGERLLLRFYSIFHQNEKIANTKLSMLWEKKGIIYIHTHTTHTY